MRLVVAIGGNALLRRGERAEQGIQRSHAHQAAAAIAPLARQNELLVTHGNGPQVGLLALQAAADRDGVAVPLTCWAPKVKE